jgi:hypothetical protein
MTNFKKRITNPLTVIAAFATLSETSAAISLPFLDNDEREIYIWFLISFPFYLLLLFFATLNFNYRSLYAPSDFEKGEHFLKVLDNTECPKDNAPPKPLENKGRNTPMNDGQSASHRRPAQDPSAEIETQSTFADQHPFRSIELLAGLYIIDARRTNKEIRFSALLEKIKKPQQRPADVIVFLTCTESEKVLKECALRHSRQMRKSDSIRLYAAYNLDSQGVTIINQR